MNIFMSAIKLFPYDKHTYAVAAYGCTTPLSNVMNTSCDIERYDAMGYISLHTLSLMIGFCVPCDPGFNPLDHKSMYERIGISGWY